jgi:hypothetical protein
MNDDPSIGSTLGGGRMRRDSSSAKESMEIRSYRLVVRNKPAAIALAGVVVLVGGALLAMGLALLAGLVVAGVVVGMGAALLRRLRGRDTLTQGAAARAELDPANEVFLPRTRREE